MAINVACVYVCGPACKDSTAGGIDLVLTVMPLDDIVYLFRLG